MKRKTMWSPLLVGFLLLWWSGCETGEILEDYSDQIPTITDGIPTNGYPSVGILSNSCTGTLVGKRSVLTAAHCVKNGGSATFVVGGTRYSSSQVFANTRGDIALVVLSRDVSNVKPTPLNTSTPKVGQRVTLVGFGVTSENGGGFGKKRMGTNTIDKVDSQNIYFRGSGNGSSSNCYGDSGGPAFMVINNQEVVAGVTSGGRVPCGTYAWDTRVDVFVDWLKEKSNGDVLLPGNTSDQGTPRVEMSKSTYGVNETIVVRYSNLPGNQTDWVGIFSTGAANTSELQYIYTKGAKSGTMQFTGRAAGSYEARAFSNDSYTLLSKVSFTVSSSTIGDQSSSNTLLPSGELTINQYLRSKDDSHRFYLQSDGDLVLSRMSDKKTLWSSGTGGKAATRLKFQSDGNLVLRTASGAGVWSSKTAGSGATKLYLHSAGQLVLYRDSTVVWSVNGR